LYFVFKFIEIFADDRILAEEEEIVIIIIKKKIVNIYNLKFLIKLIKHLI
jgi:hypothetical protein